MGVDTKVRLIGEVKAETLANWIKANISEDVKLSNENSIRMTRKEFLNHVEKGDIKEFYGKDKTLWSRANWIIFNYNGRERTMFYYYSPINWYENLEFYEPLGLANMIKSETTTLSLGCNEDAKYILTEITKAFGGWIDYNDCDDEPYVRINNDGETPEAAKHITMDDIYKAFGEFVVIDK